MKIINGFHLKNVRGDILGGITAAVVALPLALAFGNAALGPGGAIYGLYGAVVVGFLAALFGGTPAQVSGPTGPLSVTVAGVVAGLAAVGVPRDLSAGQILPLVMAAVVIGGLLQILFATHLQLLLLPSLKVKFVLQRDLLEPPLLLSLLLLQQQLHS